MATVCWEQHGGSVVHLRAFPRWVHRPVAVLSNVATELKPTPLRVQGSMDFSRTAAAVSAGLVAVSSTATTAFSTTSLGAGPASGPSGGSDPIGPGDSMDIDPEESLLMEHESMAEKTDADFFNDFPDDFDDEDLA